MISKDCFAFIKDIATSTEPLSADDRKRAKRLTDCVKDIYVIEWCIEDVQSLDDTLTDAQAREVLAYVDSHEDCAHGVTWDTLQAAIDELGY